MPSPPHTDPMPNAWRQSTFAEQWSNFVCVSVQLPRSVTTAPSAIALEAPANVDPSTSRSRPRAEVHLRRRGGLVREQKPSSDTGCDEADAHPDVGDDAEGLLSIERG